MLVYICPLSVSVAFCECVCPINFCPGLSILQAVKHNAGLMFAHRLRDEPTLAQHWVTESCLAPR